MCSSFWVEPAHIEDVFNIFLLVDFFADKGFVKPLSPQVIRSCHQDFLVARQASLSFQDPDKIVGCCALFSVSDVLLELRSFVVDEEYVGRGVAKMLMRRAIHLAKKNKKKLFCFSQRNSFFEKLGFSEISRAELDIDPTQDERYSLDRDEPGLKIYLFTP